jgi:hypothetical protein
MEANSNLPVEIPGVLETVMLIGFVFNFSLCLILKGPKRMEEY